MKLTDMLPFRAAFLGLLLLAVSVRGDNLAQKYCSSFNTASGPANYNNYQSLGSCSTRCSQENFAYGVVQGLNCWCSNYTPAEQDSLSSCNTQCPGYPYELCGNPNTGFYGYIALDKAPLGTKGAPKSSNKNAPPPNPAPSSEAPSSIPPSSSSLSSSTSAEATTTKSEVKTEVTTISGSAVTQTVTRTPIGMVPNHDPEQPALESKGLSDGAIAGVVIGTLLGIALIVLGAFLLWRRRRQSDTERGSSRSPKRKGSVLSRTGLLGAARPQSMTENTNDEPYSAEPGTRTNSIRHSMMFGASNSGEGVSPNSPLGGSQDGGSDRRISKPLVYDQRLNPSALWAHHDNGSRVSMQDQQDYSRPLGLTNPDFPRSYSFDSR